MIAHSLTQELEHRGISRRDFMGFCASMAAVLGLPDYAGPAIAAAVETEAETDPGLARVSRLLPATRNLCCAPAIRQLPISFSIRFPSTTMKL